MGIWLRQPSIRGYGSGYGRQGGGYGSRGGYGNRGGYDGGYTATMMIMVEDMVGRGGYGCSS